MEGKRKRKRKVYLIKLITSQVLFSLPIRPLFLSSLFSAIFLKGLGLIQEDLPLAVLDHGNLIGPILLMDVASGGKFLDA